MRLLRMIYGHGKDIFFNGKRQQDYEQGIYLRGRYYYHQKLDLGEEKGCALTCLAMAFSNYKKRKITPVQVYKWNMNSYRIYWNIVFFRAGLKWREVILQHKTNEEKIDIIKNLLIQHTEGIIGEFKDKKKESVGMHYVLLDEIKQTESMTIICTDPMGKGDNYRGDLSLPETYAGKKYGGQEAINCLNRLIYIQHTSYKIIFKKSLRKKLRFLKYCFPLKLRTKILIYKYTHHWPEIKYPVTFIDKLLAYMWSDKMEEYSCYADKIAVREYVNSTIGKQYLTKFYGSYTSLNQVDFSGLPDKFYVKANHGCKWNIPVENKKEFCQQLSQNEKQMQLWLKDNLWNRFGERQYKKIKPAFFIEEYLPLIWPRDIMLRVYCFGGQPIYINLERGFLGEEKDAINLWYDRDWVLQPCLMHYPGMDYNVKKPDNLQEILMVATKLADPFPFVRVDLYNLEGKRIVFSELTFTPSGDRARVLSHAWDKKLGDLFPLQ